MCVCVCMFKEKLRTLKEKPGTWNYEVFGKLDLNMGESIVDLNDLDHKVSNDI